MIKVFEAFAGYGGASFALKKANIEHKVVGFSEVDKNAIKCFLQNHGDIKNFGDITKINPNDIPDFDLFTGGFPCQAFSTAGKQLGELDTRGTLFRDIIRICEVKQPKYILLENVKGLTTKKFQSTFLTICQELERIGYKIRHRVLNTKDFGIPQNRQRIYFVCIRKDLNQSFEFPDICSLYFKLEEIFEHNVDKKYYFSEKAINGMVNSKYRNKKMNYRGQRIKTEIMSTLTTNMSKNDIIFPTMTLELSKSYGKHFPPDKFYEFIKEYRRLTPTECFKLMGFTEKDKLDLSNISDVAKYKLVGNGWDINLVSKILKNLLKEY